MPKIKQELIDRLIDDKNKKFALNAYNLSKAKKESAFWGSNRGVVNRLPSAMKDTVMNAIRKATNKYKKNK